MGVLVPCQRKGGWLVSLEVMAAFAGVEVWSRRKLAGVLVAVAIGAVLELDFEERVFPLWNMALVALHRGVLSLQRISRGCVVLHGEFRGFEAIHRMAGGALSSSGALGELSLVRIGLVAIHTLLEGQRLLEISAGVALRTIYRGVFT